MLTSTTTLELPSSRLAQIVTRERRSKLASRLFVLGIVVFAIAIAVAIVDGTYGHAAPAYVR
jgi:hypothetical protein